MRDVLLQPFRSHKYEGLKTILIERRGLTTPERVNKVISGERMGSNIPSRFLRRLQKTAGFETKAVVGKAVIRRAFIRQMPVSIRAHLATQPDSATLESLAMLADRALASEEDVEESKPGVVEIKVDETTKLVGLLEDLSKRHKKLETATADEKKRNQGRGRVNNHYTPRPTFIPNGMATQPDSATLESLAMLADRALASEEDVEESKPGVVEIKVDETTKLVGLLEDLSKRHKKLETATADEKKRNQGRGCVNNHYTPRPTFIPNVQATEFVPNKPGNYNNVQRNARPFVPPPNVQQNNAAKVIDTANAPVCYFHQTFGDKARTCRSPCAFSLNC